MVDPKRVLVVDDSRVARMMIKLYILNTFADWTVFEAQSGEQSIEEIESIHPDIVTMDVNMQGMSGLDAAEEILQRFPKLCVILITANVQESSRKRAEEIGAHFLQKPVTEAALKAALEAFLAK
jgi:CheY-like chemotaxis protein